MTQDLPDPQTLFKAADILRGSVDAAEYKHLVLGLLFLKYVSESFEARRRALETELAETGSEGYIEDDAERAEALDDKDEYVADNVFFIPPGARWSEEDSDPEKQGLLQWASRPKIGERIDRALELVERENEQLPRGVLPRIYARAPLSAEKLGALVETIGRIPFGSTTEARDYLGRTYEYFIANFAAQEGRNAGEYYTPKSVTKLLVGMLEPYAGRVFDPSCGSCGLFIQSAHFVDTHGRSADQLAIYGQEMNQATWRIGQMNLAIHGLSGDVRYTENGSLLDDAFPNLKADFVLANPPFNQDPWGAQAVKDDVRWKHGLPPDTNANFAWMQHFLHHLAPDGRAGFVMANGSLTTKAHNEGDIRERLVRADVVDCVVALPAQLFFSTGIPVSLWFFDRNKASEGERPRQDEVLFIDARQLGHRISQKQRELTDDDIELVAGTYRAWRGTGGTYADVPGFCYSATRQEIEEHGFLLGPARYVGASDEEEEEVAFEERMAGLVDALSEDIAEVERLTTKVREGLATVGYAL